MNGQRCRESFGLLRDERFRVVQIALQPGSRKYPFGHFAQGEPFQIQKNRAPRKRFPDGSKHGPLLRTGQHEHAGSPILVNPPLDARNQFRTVLDLVQNQRRRMVPEEKLGIGSRIADVDNGIEHNGLPIGQMMREERTLSDLPGARHDENWKMGKEGVDSR